MKIRCPVCKTSYNLPTERLTKPVVRAACKRCGNTLVIHKDTGEVETTAPSPRPTQKPPDKNIQTPTAIPPSLSVRVAGRAHRDYLPIIVVVAVLMLLAAAGYSLVSNSGKGFFAKSGESVSEEVKGANRFKVCRSFVRKDKKLLASVGKNGRLTLLDDEVLVWKGKEMARVTARVQGSKGSKRLQILLLKEEGQWRVISASEERKVAKASSQPESKKKPSTKALPSRFRKKPHKNRLPATTTNKLLADYVRSKPNIENLYLNKCRNITDISPLASLSRLSVLSMDWCSKLENISPLTNLKGLKQLNLHKCESLVDLTPLTKIASLRVLHLPPTTTDEKLAQVLTHLPQLEKLVLKDCHQVTDISPVAGLANLNHLEMNYAPELVDITHLAGLTRLKVLDLKNTRVQDLKALAKLSSLEWLYLSDSKRVNDISPLKNLNNLKILSLNGCKGVRDITALSKLTKLTILNLSELEEISDISTLSNLTQLRNLYLRRCKKISPTQIRELRKSLPRCSIAYRDAHVGIAR
jgi:Leucine-rich repeat (LRR) protein